jgi:hypothetical protein
MTAWFTADSLIMRKSGLVLRKAIIVRTIAHSLSTSPTVGDLLQSASKIRLSGASTSLLKSACLKMASMDKEADGGINAQNLCQILSPVKFY